MLCLPYAGFFAKVDGPMDGPTDGPTDGQLDFKSCGSLRNKRTYDGQACKDSSAKCTAVGAESDKYIIWTEYEYQILKRATKINIFLS